MTASVICPTPVTGTLTVGQTARSTARVPVYAVGVVGEKSTFTTGAAPPAGMTVTGQVGALVIEKTDGLTVTSVIWIDALPMLDRVTSWPGAVSPIRVGEKATGLGVATMAAGPAVQVPVWQVSLAVHGSPLSQV